jgi:SAM-dependent methyltransferase
MLVPDNGHLRREDVRLSVYRCRSCDLVFLNPLPPAELGRGYFADAYSSERKTQNLYYDDAFKERVSRIRLDVVEGHIGSRGMLLDVGCGKGHFVAAAGARGWTAWGVELDSSACQQAVSHFKLDTIRQGSLDHPDLPAPFDVITLWDVIEHVPNPLQFLCDARDRLRDGGLLVIRTANIRSWRFDQDPYHWWAFGCDHRFYFGPRSLGAILRAADCEVLEILNLETKERPEKAASQGRKRSFREGALALSRAPWKVVRLGGYCRNIIRRRSGHLRYGDHYHTSIMTVIARKVDQAGGGRVPISSSTS